MMCINERGLARRPDLAEMRKIVDLNVDAETDMPVKKELVEAYLAMLEAEIARLKAVYHDVLRV